MNLCRTCVGQALHECDERGEPLAFVQSCSPYLHCEEVEPERATCVTNDCISGSKACINNEVRACGEDGKYLETGSDCGEQQCFLGECHDKVCASYGDLLCFEGDVYQCGFMSLSLSSYDACEETTHCVDDGTPACSPMPCLPGEGTCLGNHTGKCAEDGQSLATDVSDCAAQGQVCDLIGGCVASAMDTLQDETVTFPWNQEGLHGIVVDVHSDRLLKTLQAPLTLVETAQVSWLLYEQVDAGYELRANVGTDSASLEGLFVSAVFDEPLRAGKRYVLAVHTTEAAATTDFVSGYLGQRWSFAVLLEGVSRQGPPESDYIFNPNGVMIRLRATTGPLVD